MGEDPIGVSVGGLSEVDGELGKVVRSETEGTMLMCGDGGLSETVGELLFGGGASGSGAGRSWAEGDGRGSNWVGAGMEPLGGEDETLGC